MATLNPFDLLEDDAEDSNQIVAAKPLKIEKSTPVQPADLPSKPLPPSQAVRERAKNFPNGGRGGGRGGGFGRGRGNSAALFNGNGYGGGYRRSEGDGARRGGPTGGGYRRSEEGHGVRRGGPAGGGYRRSEEGDGARRGGPSGEGYRRSEGDGVRRGGGYLGGRGDHRVSFSNGDSGDLERPRRNFERRNGTGHNVTEESTTAVEKNVAVDKQGGEAESNKETPVEEQAEKKPEDNEMTLEEYEKVLEEKKKALQLKTIEERKVDTKVFESMQQLSSKKSNTDDIFIKLGAEKDKRIVEKEEKTKKVTSLNEFLKPVNGESNFSRGGRGGKGGAVGGGNQRHSGAAAPAIEDTAQFPSLGK